MNNTELRQIADLRGSMPKIQEDIRRKLFIFSVCLMLISSSVAAQSNKISKKGLYVQDGILMKDSRPFRAIGANYFSLFYNTIKSPNDLSYKKNLKQLSDAGIPFVRFMCSGFWPLDYELYLKNKGEYFRKLDDIIKTAEKCKIGLIPSLFWNYSAVPDIVGEPMNKLGDPNSKTIGFIRQYTAEIVSRYKDSPAIWAWEMGNEYNLVVDLPNASEHRPPVWPNLKTAAARTQNDELTSKDMLTAYEQFAQTVHRFDKDRIIITGNSIPRLSAYHNTKEKSWTQDAPEQFAYILQRDNPDQFNTICVHIYPEEKNDYPADQNSSSGLIKKLMQYSNQFKKPLFIGEFGVPVQKDKAKERKEFEELLSAIEVNKVPLAAFWVFDLDNQNDIWNVTFTNERSYIIDEVRRANLRIQNELEQEPVKPVPQKPAEEKQPMKRWIVL